MMRILFLFLMLAAIFSPKDTACERIEKDHTCILICGAACLGLVYVIINGICKVVSNGELNLTIKITNWLDVCPWWMELIFWIVLTVVVCCNAVDSKVIESDKKMVHDAEITILHNKISDLKQEKELYKTENNEISTMETEVSCNSVMTYKEYKETITKGIKSLVAKEKLIEDEDLRSVISVIKTVLAKIRDTVDETEYKSGNLAKLNTFYLPTFIELITKYTELQKVTEFVDVAEPLKETRQRIIDSKAIYINILKDSLDNDVEDVMANGRVYRQMAITNGLLQDRNTLKMEKL